MRNRIVRLAGIPLLATLVMTPSLAAQRALSLNVGGGLTLPQGQLGRERDMGWHALLALSLGSPVLPMGFRLEGNVNRFQRTSGAPVSIGDQSTVSVTLNTTYRLPLVRSPISPYVITGLGGYRTSCSDSAPCGESTRFGWNAGAGLRFARLGLRGFIESRYHATGSGAARFIPVTFALTF